MNPGKARILIVDDETANIKLLGSALKEEYQVSFATSGEDALKIALSDTPVDLVLLDIVMRGMNGYEVCARLKGNENTKNVPVIFITSMSEEEDETKGLEIGAVDYITKPFSMAIVKARVRTHIELKRHRDMLAHLSALDALTGIPNRRRFDEFISAEWKRAIREATCISMIMIDIDFFKAYNDNYGHYAGDECLRRVACALVEAVKRPSDLVARYGGEEFAVVLPRTEKTGAVFLAERMRENIERLAILHEFSGIQNYITISLGTATMMPTNASSMPELINGSDRALYEAKRGGRNQMQSMVIS